jgi:hypothetical protein
MARGGCDVRRRGHWLHDRHDRHGRSHADTVVQVGRIVRFVELGGLLHGCVQALCSTC